MPTDVDWHGVYDVVSKCSKCHDPRGFGMAFLDHIQKICPFQQGLAYLIDANHKLSGYYLKNIEEHYNRAYLDYYAQTDDRFYNCFIDLREDPNRPVINVHNWMEEYSSEFIPEYINERGVKHSVGFALFDLDGNIRLVIALDRMVVQPFTNRELYHLQLIRELLNECFKNFFYHGNSWSQIDKDYLRIANLTAREIEVVDYMSQGISPANISKILCISQSTTYKHIAHIYSKLGVSNKQELLVKLLRKTEPK